MYLFQVAYESGDKRGPLPKKCHTYPTMMKLGTVLPYLKRSKKYIYINHVTFPLSSADSSIFSSEIRNLCCIKKCRYRLNFNISFLIILPLLRVLRVVLINRVAILIMSVKLATLGLSKIKLF